MHEADGIDGLRSTADFSRWVEALSGDFGKRFQSTLAALPLDVLARYPMPRTGRLPFGRELSVLTNLLSGRSVQLHSSGLWRAYTALAPNDHALLYQAFTLGAPIARIRWENVLGR